jgi:DNA-binding NarL/FixJ family response regulator
MKKISVLVMEDSPIIKKRIKDILNDTKVVRQLFFAEGLPESVAIIDRYAPEVVFLDINLPDGNGLKNLYDIRQKYPAIKVVIITNQEYEKYKQVSMHLGAYCYLDKSYDFDKIATVIQEISRAHASAISKP